MVPRDRFELSTPAFSAQCSTPELPRHNLTIRYLIITEKIISNKPVFNFLKQNLSKETSITDDLDDTELTDFLDPES